MSASVTPIKISNQEANVAHISVNARIDYIMRFSKNAVLVISDESNSYTMLGSQYLGNLPGDHNAAYISISSKLNDIQVRCRLIEQLFTDSLFDPEEPLAAMVLKLAKDKSQAISIVVENSHFLSLQLLHEFCQLAEIAGKANRVVNVLLLGQEVTGRLIAENKATFNNKITMLSPSNGQIIPIDSAQFNKKSAESTLSIRKKILLFIGCLFILCILILVSIYQSTDLFTGRILNSNDNLVMVTEPFVIDKTLNSTTDTHKNSVGVISDIPLESIDIGEIASSSEVFLQLSQTDTTHDSIKIMAQPSEIANMLSTFNNYQYPSITTSDMDKVDPKMQSSSSYFMASNNGFVAQIVGFSDQKAYEKFIEAYQYLDLVSYRRLLNNKEFIIITTKIYPLKSDAKAAIDLLPEELKLRGPWVKTVSAINNEINAYQSSH